MPDDSRLTLPRPADAGSTPGNPGAAAADAHPHAAAPILLGNLTAEPWFTETPQVVGIEITGLCNLRCRHCFNESGPDNGNEIPFEVLERVFDEVAGWGGREVRLSGGEPTLHRRFPDVVAACRERSLAVVLNTNGIYAPAIAKYLLTASIDRFLVSLDGLETGNDAIRGAGTFPRIVDSIQRLHGAGQRVTIAFHVGETNRRDVAPVVELAGRLGVDVKISPLRPIGRAAREMPGSLIRPESYLEVVRDVVRLRRDFPGIRIWTDFDILGEAPPEECQPGGSSASCKAGRTMININYDGGIYPCAFFVTLGAGFCAGNVHRDRLSDVWRRSPAFTPFRMHQKDESCHGCSHYRQTCSGGCPAISQAVTGRLDALDPTCFAGLLQPESSLSSTAESRPRGPEP